MMRALVCGGRDFDDARFVYAVLDHLMPSEVIEGGATGADAHAADWAKVHLSKTALLTFKADWKTHGRAAGPIRNQRMIDEGKPDLVIAFPGGRGTADMVRRARKAGIPVREFPVANATQQG